MSEAKQLNLFQRLVEIWKETAHVIKDDSVTVGSETYAAVTHDMVARTLHPVLAKHGIICWPTQESCRFDRFDKEKGSGNNKYIQNWYTAEVVIKVTLFNADNPQEKVETNAAAFAMDTSDKAASKAYSLAFKMALLKCFMLESRDQEEQRIFEREEDRKTRSAQPPKNPSRPVWKMTMKMHEDLMTAAAKGGVMDQAGVENYMRETFKKERFNQLTELEYNQIMKAVSGGT